MRRAMSPRRLLIVGLAGLGHGWLRLRIGRAPLGLAVQGLRPDPVLGTLRVPSVVRANLKLGFSQAVLDPAQLFIDAGFAAQVEERAAHLVELAREVHQDLWQPATKDEQGDEQRQTDLARRQIAEYTEHRTSNRTTSAADQPEAAKTRAAEARSRPQVETNRRAALAGALVKFELEDEVVPIAPQERA